MLHTTCNEDQNAFMEALTWIFGPGTPDERPTDERGNYTDNND